MKSLVVGGGLMGTYGEITRNFPLDAVTTGHSRWAMRAGAEVFGCEEIFNTWGLGAFCIFL